MMLLSVTMWRLMRPPVLVRNCGPVYHVGVYITNILYIYSHYCVYRGLYHVHYHSHCTCTPFHWLFTGDRKTKVTSLQSTFSFFSRSKARFPLHPYRSETCALFPEQSDKTNDMDTKENATVRYDMENGLKHGASA